MLPHDQRNFVHKRLLGGAVGFLTGGPGGAVAGFAGGGRSGGQPGVTVSTTRPRFGRGLTRDPCPQPGTQMGTRGCYHAATQNPDGTPKGGARATATRVGQFLIPGGQSGLQGVGSAPAGAAVMGQYGAALEPFVEDRHVRTCLPGMVLGKDGLCYNRRDISNKEREWPRGTRPLGTPGEMAALRKAASFGRRMETTVKRMQKIGVLKKPSSRRRQPGQYRPGYPKPSTSIVNVE